MKIKLIIITLALSMIFVFGCKKKELPNAKFVGTYKVVDTWGSSKSEIGSGTLEYTLTITADGETGIILDNVNKTLFGIKAKVSGDSLIVQKQTTTSKTGKIYEVDNKSGTMTNNKLNIDFGYDDLNHGDAIGYVYAMIRGDKEVKSESK
jgi:hypothetical protein